MLWLAVSLPSLSLEVFAQASSRPEPWAVVEQRGRSERVLACNPLAAAAGVQPGMKRSAAAALAGTLRISRRRPDLESATLASLATWAQQFTPTVSLTPPAALLLEIGGCIAYFHGLDLLTRLIRQGLADQGHAPLLGVAPTPLAAQWLAQAGCSEPVLDAAQLEGILSRLPIESLPLPDDRLADLRLLGAHRLQQVFALPRQGLARRFGKELPLLLDRALGRAADTRASFVAPARFSKRLELAWPVDTTDTLLFVGRQLSITLGGYLAGLGLGVQQLVYRLEHNHREATLLDIGYGKPTRQVNELVAVLREKLTHHQLPAPVEAMTLIADQLHPLDGASLDLFGDAGSQANIELLQARLLARLGDGAVRRIATAADHRPEYAWKLGENRMATSCPAGERPAWLLPEPLALQLRDHRPWHREALICRSRAERVETGWWDGHRVVRDYYLALGESGRRYWIFQDRVSHGWFLHGLFD